MKANDVILSVSNLSLDLRTEIGYVPLLQNLSFQLEKGKVLALVGESGCGKSICSLALTKLLPLDLFRVAGGEILFESQNLLTLPSKKLEKIRGKDIAYVFQEPFSSLDPLQKIKDQMTEGYLIHSVGSRKEAEQKAEYLLSSVGITDVTMRMESYPHQLSGGILQRVCIAMALMCNPKLLIADEPTSALDVTVQAQLVELLLKLKGEFGLSVLFISHDFGLVSHIADKICVLYAGNVSEIGETDSVIEFPSHPYTQDLLNSLPSRFITTGAFKTIEGRVPSPGSYPPGCHYQNRCRSAFQRCRESKPELYPTNRTEHLSSCFLVSDKGGKI
ncbi:oligopeptide/dipeptide transporter, C-terminal domain protein [Leptospira inadai serovar Lyme str. 10]|uniref:Oligopeptide/dipeptide transporter, C-terminal domain protein n=2 Tax=Leptospira inadai serovar Lyme TaxID=293084 RepID=V6H810_9LEPT|nr:ABC transporter ATP-binding protein [Leptospira inadai]EQA34782.1 oligopeptide/dipeptide transporter, C-terminal domain protein [Leptospira inadai serovar Lyme str. 10]PNV76034.1 dipeptide/oligopeptide/nickel ABC transporter ATP-binding protein [Leptospira inadai serovar Lyme]